MLLRAGVERLQASSQPLCGGNWMGSDTNLSRGLELTSFHPNISSFVPQTPSTYWVLGSSAGAGMFAVHRTGAGSSLRS